MAREAYEAATTVTGVSPWTVRLQESLGARSLLLQNGVAAPTALAGAAAVRPAAGPRIGFVGRVAPVKDIVTFLRAGRLVVDEVPGAELVVVGPLHHHPLYAERCIDEARRLGIEQNVTFVGEADPGPWYPTFDALVLTSVSEAQPLVALEAMAAGVPVVATAVGGCVDLIGGAGLLTPSRDPRATARAVVRLLSDPALHARAAAAGRERVESAHRLDQMVGGYETLYHRVAGRSGRA
jgi:glycosyltransferase involved in cell wall biosynthesis